MIDLETAFKFPTTDRDWKSKVMIGGVLNIVPVINFLSMGYALGLFQRGLEGEELGILPEWEHWGTLFVQGLIVFLIGLIYNLASLILFLIHPVLGFLAFVAVSILFPAALAQYVLTGNFSQAFALGEIWRRIQQTRNDYFIAWLVVAGITIVLVVVGMIPVLGYLISAIIGFYAYLVFAVLFGEICSRPNHTSRNGYDPPIKES